VREALDCPSNRRPIIQRTHALAHPTEPAFTTQVSGTGAAPLLKDSIGLGLYDRKEMPEGGNDE